MGRALQRTEAPISRGVRPLVADRGLHMERDRVLGSGPLRSWGATARGWAVVVTSWSSRSPCDPEEALRRAGRYPPPGIAGHLMTVAQRVAQGLKDSDDPSVPRRRFHDWGGRTKEAQWSPEHHTPGDVGPDGGRSAAGREQVAPTGQQYGGEDGHQHDADLGCRLAEQTPPPYPSAALPPGWGGQGRSAGV